MSKIYNNPPLVEALCEFRFKSTKDQEWDITIPGRFYEEIKSKFPKKKQVIDWNIEFQAKGSSLEQKANPSSTRIQFFKEEMNSLLQISPNLFVANVLKPYKNWEHFRELILSNYKIYKSIANPEGFYRVKLRYINKINIELETIKLSDYFQFHPHIPDGFPGIVTNFISRVEFPFNSNKDILLLTIAGEPQKESERRTVLLDLEYLMIQPSKDIFTNFEEWLETAHTNIEEIFELSITEKSRISFKEK